MKDNKRVTQTLAIPAGGYGRKPVNMPWPGISPESQYAWMGHSAHLFLADLFAKK